MKRPSARAVAEPKEEPKEPETHETQKSPESQDKPKKPSAISRVWNKFVDLLSDEANDENV